MADIAAPARAQPEARAWAPSGAFAVAPRLKWALGLLLPLGLALGWEAAVRFGFVEGRLMPPPSRIFETLYALARSGELWVHASATLWRVTVG
ncbi:MAG TPA: ABC transporter permease, partial [Beijerinckiaceae bacterium]|nr:ABC transporter permease [Beijerinckiaceae bacterium]